MSQQIAEQLSSLTDGELGADSSRFLLRRMAGDGNLRDMWSRFHIAKETMRGGQIAVFDDDFASRVAAAIDAEPAPQQAEPEVSPSPGWLKPVAGAAIAATVAVAALTFVNVANQTATELPPVAVAATGSTELTSDELSTTLRPPLPSRNVSWGQVNAQPGLDPQLGNYVLRHNRQSASFRTARLVPYMYFQVTPAQAQDETDESTAAGDQ